MKTFEQQITVGNFYCYNVFKIVDGNWQIYYQAEPIGKGVTRIGETIEELRRILEADVKTLNEFYIKVR